MQGPGAAPRMRWCRPPKAAGEADHRRLRAVSNGHSPTRLPRLRFVNAVASSRTHPKARRQPGSRSPSRTCARVVSRVAPPTAGVADPGRLPCSCMMLRDGAIAPPGAQGSDRRRRCSRCRRVLLVSAGALVRPADAAQPFGRWRHSRSAKSGGGLCCNQWVRSGTSARAAPPPLRLASAWFDAQHVGGVRAWMNPYRRGMLEQGRLCPRSCSA